MLAPVQTHDRDRGADRARVAGIAAAIVCIAVVGIGLSLTIPLLSIEMARMGASPTVIGLNTACAGFASIAAVPFVPRLAARVGVVPLIVVSIVAAAVILCGFRALYGLAWWFPLRLAFSTCLGALFVLSEYWISEAAPVARRGLVMGIYATVLALGFAVGPVLLAATGTEGWTPYGAGAAMLLLGLVPIGLARDLSPGVPTGNRGSFAGALRLAPVALLAAAAYGAVETGGFAILPLYGLRLGFDAEGAARLVTAVALGSVLFQIPVGLLADRIDRRRVLLGASLGGALTAALIPGVSGSASWLAAMLFAWGGIAGTLYTVGLAHLGASARGSDLAGANAAFVVFYNVGLILGPPLIGGGMDLAPPQGFAWTLTVLFLAYAAVVARDLVRGR